MRPIVRLGPRRSPQEVPNYRELAVVFCEWYSLNGVELQVLIPERHCRGQRRGNLSDEMRF
jgi:hypothetical protein